jgi:hypothetical protein
MNLDDLFRRLRGSNPYPDGVELTDDPTGQGLHDIVRARIEAGRAPEPPAPRHRGPLLAVATAVAVLVVGVGVFLFARRDEGGFPPATQPTVTTAATLTTEPPPTTEPTPTTGSGTTTTVTSTLPGCGESEPEARPGWVLAFYAICEAGTTAPYPVYRATDDDRDELALLILGTNTREQARGLSTGWDSVPVEERQRISLEVSRSPDNVLTLEFTIDGEEWRPGQLASASAQLQSFLDPLQATIFATEANAAAIDLSNLCWGEMGCGPAGSNVATRADWEGGLFVNYGLITAPGCDLEWSYFVDGACSIHDAATAYDGRVINVADDDMLNVRSGPGVEYFRVAEVEPGGRVLALVPKAPATDGGLWQTVRLLDGTTGWVNSAFIAPASQLGDRTPEEQLSDALVAFAKRPADDTFSALPLADTVELGIGGDIFEVHPAAELRSGEAWIIEDVADFDGLVGPFSALETLRSSDRYEVTTGEHMRCAGPPRDYPAVLADFDQISVQPVPGPQWSCLQWYSVDLFVTSSGGIEAVFLDLWGP